MSKYSATRSLSTTGANGRNDSRNLIFKFIVDCSEGLRASPMMLRAPSARGPNSIRPWNHPTTSSSAIKSATASHRPAWLVEKLVPHMEGRTQRSARIAGGRLHPDFLERPFALDAPIRHAVERDTAGEAQVWQPGLRVHVTCSLE